MRKCGCQGVGGQFCGGCHTASSLEAAQVRIASKQGRINAIDADEDITLVSVQNIDEEMFDVDVLDGDEGKSQSQDKGKGILVEEPVKPVKKKDQIRLDEEAALRLQVEFDEEERLAREIDADYQLAKRLQAEEQEQFTIEEKAILFKELLEQRRKHFAAKRSEEQRNKPLTKAQQRKIMCNYLKNMEGYKFKYLKSKGLDIIQEMFDRAFKRVNTFEDFRTELVEGKEKRAGGRIVGIKSLLNAASITAVLIDVNVAQSKNDNALWEVIENGATLPKITVVEGVEKVMPITSAEDKAQRRLEVKDISTLMMGIPNEHQLKFNSIKDAKTVAEEAVGKEIGLQKLVSQLKLLDEKILQEDVNQTLLRSLSPEWNTHVCVEDKAEKWLLSYSSNNNTASSNDAVFAHGVILLAPFSLDTAYSTNIDNLSDAVICFLKNTGRKLTVNGNETIGFDKNQDNKNKESSRRSVPVETSIPKSLCNRDGLGDYDWSNQAEEGPNYALMAYSSSSSDSKIVDNCKKRLGYEKYNAVPPPYTGNFMPPTPDLSFTGLDEFVNKPVVENRKSDEEVLVLINTARQVNTAHSKPTLNAARPMSYLSKTTHSTVKRPIHKNISFKNSNINQRVNTVRDKNVNTARSKPVVNAVKGNNINAFKALACWVWKPKTKVLDHVSKHNSASITLKKFDYIDAQGRSKSLMAWVSKRN
ncbi:hypothetical protein Tco_0064631 [Tanacetum coccineum]